jgi:hypothetical protein
MGWDGNVRHGAWVEAVSRADDARARVEAELTR